MNKKYIIIWSLIWIVLGSLVSISILNNLITGLPMPNIIFMLGLTLFCFFNGIHGLIRAFGKDEDDEKGAEEEAKCSGG